MYWALLGLADTEKPDLAAVEGYGLSETSPPATFNRVDRPRKPGSIGLPAWGVEVRVTRGGFNVCPREIEEVLLTHPEVSLAALAGVPHPSHGEEVKAFVIRRAGSTVTEEEIVAWSRQNMAGHKHPRLVEFRQTLPMTATGQILKRELAPTRQNRAEPMIQTLVR